MIPSTNRASRIFNQASTWSRSCRGKESSRRGDDVQYELAQVLEFREPVRQGSLHVKGHETSFKAAERRHRHAPRTACSGRPGTMAVSANATVATRLSRHPGPGLESYFAPPPPTPPRDTSRSGTNHRAPERAPTLGPEAFQDVGDERDQQSSSGELEGHRNYGFRPSSSNGGESSFTRTR